MALVLFRRPGTVAVLDDDADFLELAGTSLRTRWRTNVFSEPDALIQHANQEVPFEDADLWTQQEAIGRWRSGSSSLPTEILSYWARNTERFALTRVAVVDYVMPQVTGLDVLGELRDWRAKRILLTARLEESVAIAGFNAGLIHRFLTKFELPLAERLLWTVEELMESPDSRLEELWRGTLNREQSQALASPRAAAGLEAFLGDLFVEHVATAEPFGFMGITQHGLVGWVPLTIGRRNDQVSDSDILAPLGSDAAPSFAKPIVFEEGVLSGGCFLIDRALGARPPPTTYSSWRRQRLEEAHV